MFDTWVHPLMMGLEEHLLRCSATISSSTTSAAPSHLGATAGCRAGGRCDDVGLDVWDADGREGTEEDPVLRPRQGRRNTERFAQERGCRPITVETLYDAKAHFGR